MRRRSLVRRMRAGVGVLKPITRKEIDISPLVIVGILAGIILVLVVALLLRGMAEIPPWVLGICAFLLAPPLVLGGYTFLRDDELDPHRGVSLIVRVLICSAVYAALWVRYAWLPALALNLNDVDLFHLLLIVPPIVLVGAFAAFYTLDLEFTDAVIHYALYVLVTVVLCVVIGVSLMGTPPAVS